MYPSFETIDDHMPFCTSCGADVGADKKFCVHCGAPMEPVTAPVVPGTLPAGPEITVRLPPPDSTLPVPPKKPSTPLIIAGIVVVLVILAAAYVVGLPMLKASQKVSESGTPSKAPVITYTPEETTIPTTWPTPEIPETPTPPVTLRDVRFEEDYESIYTLNQKFAFGQKVNFDHDLTRPPLYVKFSLTPTLITRHRLVSIGTNNEHYENTTETSPQAWFEVKVLDAATGSVIDKQGYGKDYSDMVKQDFMVRQPGNYRIEMSGNDVTADVQMLIGTP